METKKTNKLAFKTSAARKDNVLLVSSKILADLKDKGILAFKQMTDDDQKRVWQWSKEVVRQYLSELETDPSNIRNVEVLPFPKEDIKLAIQLVIPFYISQDMQSMVKKLKAAYKEIGTFQSIEAKYEKNRLAKTGLKGATSSQNARTLDPRSDRYMEISISEKKALLQEINDYVTDLETLRT